LILVKHAMPALEPGVPSRAWRLSDAGRAGCLPLADQLAAYQPTAIAASAEPKATETARIIAERLGAPMAVVADLHENDRTGLGWLGAEELEARIARFFAEPNRRIMGNETADEAHARFAAAVEDLCAHHPDENVVIVAHGTVITLFVSRRTGIPPYPFWKRLGLPSFVLLSRPEYALQAVVERIEAE
jgi:broad specificity phosphatase PhoE